MTPKNISPFYKWLKKLIDKDLVVSTCDSHGRSDRHSGRLLFVDYSTVIVGRRNDEANIFLLSNVESIAVDQEKLRIRTNVRIKEIH